MAKTVVARRQGDEFQALFFWGQLVNLLLDKNVSLVTFESDQITFVDDVVVEYFDAQIEPWTGKQYQIDAYQCKYHVSQEITFSLDNLLDPDFIKNKVSMLQRLYEAFQKYSSLGNLFRLHVVSSSVWDSKDSFRFFLSPEGFIRPSFFEQGSKSKQGKLRTKLATALGISENELKPFLEAVRFDLAINRRTIMENLDARLRLVGLLPLETATTDTRYSEIAWKWLEQGSSTFDKAKLEKMVLYEKLIDTKRSMLLAIRHQSLDPIAPQAICPELPLELIQMPFREISLDLTALYKDGKLISPKEALLRQIELARDIIEFCKNSASIETAYYGIAHVPLVFLLGYQLNIRKQIHLFEHNRLNNRWNLLDSENDYPKLTIRKGISDNSQPINVVVKFGVSYPISESDVDMVVSSPKLVIDLALQDPTPDAINSKKQLEEYAKAFRDVLDEIHNLDVEVNCVHVFYAGPVSLAFRCGQLISPTIHPRVLIYNYFNHDRPKYKWGVSVNTPVDSEDFFIQL